jgi:dihydroxy-acid dehydratase
VIKFIVFRIYFCARRARERLTNNYRSHLVTHGIERSPSRAMLRAVGFRDSDFQKPIVGAAGAYSTITACNVGLNDLVKRAV